MANAAFTQALAGTREIELTVTGRRSGRQISNPLWFVEERGTLYLVPVRGSDSDWYKNLLRTPTVRLAADGAEISAEAKPITDPAKVDEVLEKFRAKYGARDVEEYYPKQDAAVEIPLSATDG